LASVLSSLHSIPKIKTTEPTKIVNKNTILISVRAPVGELNISGSSVCIGRGLAGIECSEDKTDAKFLYYYLKSIIKQLKAQSRGTTYESVRTEDVENILTLQFPFEEQKQISEYIDNETQKIDSEILKNQKLVKLLKEKRKSLINKVVTKGLVPSVPMKDSEIKWIGEIPAHWEITALGKIINLITYGLTVRPNFVDDGIPLISGREIQKEKINFDNAPQISKEDYQVLSEKAKGKFGDLYYSKTGTIGLVAKSTENNPYAISQNIARIVPNNKLVTTEYLENFLRTDYFFHTAYSTTKAAAVRDLQLGDMKKIPMVLPPKKEQISISEYIFNETKKIDSLVSDSESQIKKLLEYRRALISEAVTGKIDVREAAA